MPVYIVRLTDPKDSQDYYLLWSTIVDAPTQVSRGLEAFEIEYHRRYQDQSREVFVERMKRVHENGTSSLMDHRVTKTLACNRAGPHESYLSEEEIIRFYCRGEHLDESHPCWKQRVESLRLLSEVNRGCLNYSDFDDAVRLFPYTETAPQTTPV